MIDIPNSLYIPDSNIIKFTFDPGEKMWIQQVRYEHRFNQTNDFGETIISSVDGKILLDLTNEINNGSVRRLDKPFGRLKIFYINLDTIEFSGPRNKVSTVYGVDKDTKYVYKLSHLYFQTESGNEVLILDETRESYLNIINLLKTRFSSKVENLLVFQEGVYIPFLESSFEKM